MLIDCIRKHQNDLHPVVSFDPLSDKLLLMDFTEANTDLSETIISDTGLFSAYVTAQLQKAGARYGIGGYAEHRTVYSRSRVFDDASGGEPRRLHLGIDIWGDAGTVVYAPLDGIVHSFAFNDAYGDYGATIILEHRLDDIRFYSLYGHLSLNDLAGLSDGKNIAAGTAFAHFGLPGENGHWPPHLHFQLMLSMEGRYGDYPGVCRYSEKKSWLMNCLDPDCLLQMMDYAR